MAGRLAAAWRSHMVDAVTAAIGSILMIGYLWLIMAKLNELPLWIVGVIGIALMLWAFWKDAFAPLLQRRQG
jgi:hypothetical protein